MKLNAKPAVLSVAFALASLGALPSASADDESINNLMPWNTSSDRLEHFLSSDNSFNISTFTITKDDVDYYLLTCSQKNWYDAPRFVGNAGVNINGPSDLDMEIYTIAGGYVTGSYGTTPNEKGSLAGMSLSTVVIKVYGYTHAYADYALWFDCRN